MHDSCSILLAALPSSTCAPRQDIAWDVKWPTGTQSSLLCSGYFARVKNLLCCIFLPACDTCRGAQISNARVMDECMSNVRAPIRTGTLILVRLISTHRSPRVFYHCACSSNSAYRKLNIIFNSCCDYTIILQLRCIVISSTFRFRRDAPQYLQPIVRVYNP